MFQDLVKETPALENSKLFKAKKLVAEIWAETLESEVLKKDWQVPFRDLGGTSIKALAVHDKLEHRLKRSIDPAWLLTKDTIEQLAKGIVELEGAFAFEAQPENLPLNQTNGSQSSDYGVSDDDIAIVAIAVRYPNAKNIEELQRVIFANEGRFSEMSHKRWGLIGGSSSRLIHGKRPYGSFLENVDCFDPEYFGVTVEEARAMDPQIRLFMELVARSSQPNLSIKQKCWGV